MSPNRTHSPSSSQVKCSNRDWFGKESLQHHCIVAFLQSQTIKSWSILGILFFRRNSLHFLLNSWQIPITRRFHCQGFPIIVRPLGATHMDPLNLASLGATHMDPLNLASSPAIPNRHPNGCHMCVCLRSGGEWRSSPREGPERTSPLGGKLDTP